MNKSKIYLVKRNFIFLVVLFQILSSSITISSPKTRKVGLSDFIYGQRILFLGDSITQDGRYVSFIEYYFNSSFPDSKLDIISIGLSSETVSGLTEPGNPYKRPCLFDRLDSALAKINPKTIVACYGMNDGIYHPQSEERMKAYQDGIKKLIDKAKSISAKLVIITPPMFDTVSARFKPVGDDSPEFGYSKPYHHYNNVLCDYSKWLMSLKIPEVTVIDLHTAMTDYVLQKRKEIPTFSFSKDGIHPQSEGHLFMAQQFMKALGVGMANDSLSTELKRIEADSLYMLVKQHRETRSKGWLEYIGYTLGKTVKTNEINSVEKEVALFKQKIEIKNQENPPLSDVKERPNSVYIELGGNSGFWSLNFEQSIPDNYIFRIGVSLLPSFDKNGGAHSVILLMVSHLIPLNEYTSYLELGAGYSGPLTFTIGYRYVPKDWGGILKIALTPFLILPSKGDKLRFIPWLGISFGYRF